MGRTLAINQATLMRTPADKFLEAVAANEYNGVELRTELVDDYLTRERTSLGDLSSIIETGKNLSLVSFNALENFSFCDEKTFKREILPQAQKMVEYTYKLEGDLIVAVPSFLPSDGRTFTTEKINSKTSERILEIAAIASESDIKVGFEFLGFPTNTVTTLEQAREIVEPLYFSKHENIGIVVDTFHYAVGKSQTPLSKDDRLLYLLHMNDLPASFKGRIEEALDADRVLPGEGILDLEKMITGTSQRVPLSIELFNEDFYDKDPKTVAETCYKALEQVVRKADTGSAFRV